MATINWYPGHMTKSIRMMEDNIKLIDIAIYVLDARAPISCINPMFNKLIQRLPIIYVLNKVDLADIDKVKSFQKYLTTDKSVAVAIDSTVSKSTAEIITLIRKMCESKLIKYQNKGVRASIKAMVLGVPNTGKSTLINNLCKKSKTITGNKAGVTRGKQWVKVNDYIDVLDTPGTLYPKLNDQTIAKRLACLGSIKDEVTDEHELAWFLLNEIHSLYPELLKNRYNIEEIIDYESVMNQIAKSRGYMFKGGRFDLDRTAIAIIDDFRKGRIGKMTLESLDDTATI